MLTRLPGDVPTGTIRDLGLPARAVTALTRAGITRIEQLAGLTRRDLAAIPGLGAGTVAAIRLVVPEPSIRGARAGGSPAAGQGELDFRTIDPQAGPAEEESPTAPAIPSFDSLRASRRRSPVDVLMPAAAPAAGPPPAPGAPGGAPRPPEYADLLRLGVHVVRVLAGVPGRVVRWSVQEPVRCLRRLLP